MSVPVLGDDDVALLSAVGGVWHHLVELIQNIEKRQSGSAQADGGLDALVMFDITRLYSFLGELTANTQIAVRRMGGPF